MSPAGSKEKFPPLGDRTAEQPFARWPQYLCSHVQLVLLHGDARSTCRLTALDSEQGLGLLWAQESSISIARFSRCHLPSRSFCAYIFLTPLGLQQTGDGIGAHALVGSESRDVIQLSKWGRRIPEGGGARSAGQAWALSQHSVLEGSQVIPGQGHAGRAAACGCA